MLLLTGTLLIDIALGWFDFPMETDIDRQLKAPPFSLIFTLLLPKDEAA